ncbi:MAG TPA: hypothetical protein HPP66_02220 [Planctomycetes bacterium]|nr:hypothetical protein [Planctomycetota bacterium]
MELLRDRIKRFFLPIFSPLSLFMMSLSFLLVFFFSETLRSGLFEFLDSPYSRPRIAILLLLFTAGLVLSLYRVFAERKITGIEKHAMLFFVVMSNGFCGILASRHIIDKSAGAHPVFLVLPIWNIINCVILLASYRTGALTEKNISDEKASRFEVLAGVVVIVGIFVVCRFVFKLYWAITFSICVIYSTSFGDALSAFLHPRQRQMAEERAAAESNLASGKVEKCGLCGRVITSLETPYVINRKLIVCKECHDKIQSHK